MNERQRALVAIVREVNVRGLTLGPELSERLVDELQMSYEELLQGLELLAAHERERFITASATHAGLCIKWASCAAVAQ